MVPPNDNRSALSDTALSQPGSGGHSGGYAALAPTERAMQPKSGAGPNIKELLLAPAPRVDELAPPRSDKQHRAISSSSTWH